MLVFLTIVGLIYFCACAGFLLIYRRALRRASLRPMTLRPPQRDNVIPFRRKNAPGEQPGSNVESVNSIR